MQILDRLFIYLETNKIRPSIFEDTCGLANGYLNNRKRKEGENARGIGSEILDRIYKNYPDLNLIWLITGDGDMINSPQAQLQAQPQAQSEKNGTAEQAEKQNLTAAEMLDIMQERINDLKATVADKDKIIRLLEAKASSKK